MTTIFEKNIDTLKEEKKECTCIPKELLRKRATTDLWTLL